MNAHDDQGQRPPHPPLEAFDAVFAAFAEGGAARRQGLAVQACPHWRPGPRPPTRGSWLTCPDPHLAGWHLGWMTWAVLGDLYPARAESDAAFEGARNIVSFLWGETHGVGDAPAPPPAAPPKGKPKLRVVRGGQADRP